MSNLHDLPQEERPRERLIKYGVEALSLQELLCLIFGRGIKGESVINISHNLLSAFGSLDKITEASTEELKEIKGLGLAKACQLKACFEIARRLKKEENYFSKKSKIIKSPKDIFLLLKEKVINFHKEYFIVVSLDNRNGVINAETISVGILNSSLIHPRETFEVAIKNHAASIILGHNHPSNDLKPSQDDRKVTENLVKAGKLLAIEVVDHIIIGRFAYFSFKENELI